jgi:Lsr2
MRWPGSGCCPPGRQHRPQGRRGSAGDLNAVEVRKWAKAQGIEVKDRGRVPADLVVKLRAATS